MGFYNNAGGLARPLTKQELLNEIKIRLDRKQTNLNDIDTSRITDMSSLFYESVFINKIDISLWDTSNVTNMNYMFGGCAMLNCDLSKWDVSKVKNMHGMFFKCSNFNSDLSKWNTRNVSDMENMFYKCYKFNCDLSGWDVHNVEYMRDMFSRSDVEEKPGWYDTHRA